MTEVTFSVVLRRGEEIRAWEIRRDDGSGVTSYRVTSPGHAWMGGLQSPEDVARKRREFDAQIEAARADGWE
jgi:poly(3-hydroxybutyrate) depolymerase